MEDEKLLKYFESHGIKFKEYKHPPVFTVEESKELKKEIPGLHCKTLFLRDNLGMFYLVGMPGVKRLDSKAFRKYLGVRKIEFGSEEELMSEVGLVPGSVSIFGIINARPRDVMLILDEEVWDAKASGFHPNLNTSTVVLEKKDLQEFYDSLVYGKEVIEL